MGDIHWETILIIAIALLGSAAVGAIIQTVIYNYRNKRHPIGRRVDRFPTFDDPIGAESTRSKIIVSDGTQEYKYKELQLVQIQLNNQGDRDIDEFKFGITLSPGDVAIYIETQSPDRHHQVEQLTHLTFTEPKSEIDFALRPFLRRDTYSFRLLIVTSEISKDPGEIKFSSPQAVQFVALPTLVEIAEEAARSASIGIGPFSISLGK